MVSFGVVRRLLTSVRELIMKMAVAWLMWMWYRLGRIVSRLLQGRKKCSTLKRGIFIRLRMALICTIATRKTLRSLGKWALKLIACPLPGLGFSRKGMNWSQMKQVYSSMKTSLRSATSMALNPWWPLPTLTVPCIWLPSMEVGVVARCWNVMNVFAGPSSLATRAWSNTG